MSGCADCARTAIYIHTAQVEAEHREQVVADLKRQIKELEAKVRESEKGRRK